MQGTMNQTQINETVQKRKQMQILYCKLLFATTDEECQSIYKEIDRILNNDERMLKIEINNN